MRSRSSVANTKALAESIAAGEPPPHSPPVEKEPADPDIKPPRRRSEVAGAHPTPPPPPAEDKADDAEPQAASAELPEAWKPKDAPPPPSDSLVPTTEQLVMGGGYDRLVRHFFDAVGDPMDTYERVRESLRLGTRASQASYGEIVDALDQAEEMAATAMELLINAKVTHDAFEIDAKVIKSAMWEKATAVLEDEKASGVRKKAITIADVEAYMAANMPDEWRSLEVKMGQARRMVAMIEDLAERTRQRAGHLRVMARGTHRE